MLLPAIQGLLADSELADQHKRLETKAQDVPAGEFKLDQVRALFPIGYTAPLGTPSDVFRFMTRLLRTG